MEESLEWKILKLIILADNNFPSYNNLKNKEICYAHAQLLN